MEVKIKNGQLPQMIGELRQMLTERLTLGTKHRIQKILKKLEAEFNDYNPSLIDLLKKHGATETTSDNGQINYSLKPEQITNEFITEKQQLDDIENTLHIDVIDFAMVEGMETTVNYSFDLLAPFFENIN